MLVKSCIQQRCCSKAKPWHWRMLMHHENPCTVKENEVLELLRRACFVWHSGKVL